jgi:uncharacterized RDD family membrane protein YckC
MARRLSRYTQLAREALLRGGARSNPENRLWAKTLDFALIFALSAPFLWVSVLAAAFVNLLLWSVVDALGRGQSPGKWLLGLHTIELRRGEKTAFNQGLIRNLPFAQVSIGLFCPGVLPWLLIPPAALWLLGETYFIFKLKTGLRIGDVLAGTRVFDYKDEHTQFIEQFLKEAD